MVVLCRRNRARVHNLYRDRLVEAAALFQRRLASLGEFFLLWRGCENRRPVLIAAVAKLAAAVEQIDMTPVIVQQLVVADDLGIVFEPHGLGMAGSFRRDLLVRWVIGLAAQIT